MRRKLFLILFTLIMLSSTNIFGYTYCSFQARKVSGNGYWNTLEYNEFETQVVMDGLFYETTLTMRVRLGLRMNSDGSIAYPESGDYQFIWNFRLPEDAVVTECNLWDESSSQYLAAQMIDLSTGEDNYNSNNTSSQQLLMREYRNRQYNGSWDNFLELKLKPVGDREYKKIQIKYLSQANMVWNARRFKNVTRIFYNPYRRYYNGSYKYPNNDNSAKFKLIDKSNPESKPQNIASINLNWTKQGTYWRSEYPRDGSYSNWNDNAVLSFPMVNSAGKYVKTYDDGDNKFYQFSLLPDITDDDRPGRHIIVAIDMVNNGSNIFEKIKEPLQIATTSKDSILFIVSDFNPKWLDNNFRPVSDILIAQKLNQATIYDSELNTLPFMLREAVNRFNFEKKPGEIWLISDDDKHGDTAKKVTEIVNQTIFSANQDLKLRILDVSYGGNYVRINNEYYSGNQYLYENLFRLTNGTYKRLLDYNSYDWADVALDVFAPTVGVVEIDAIPQNGFSYSRADLNNGRKSFNITSRYYQIGLYDGDAPFDIMYNGSLNESLYRKSFSVNETEEKNECDIFTKTYWYTQYVRDHLLQQPQTFETIKYIEEIAVANNILTPYSGFLLPGLDQYVGFTALTLDDTIKIVQSPTKLESITKLPEEFTMKAFPNPFNPSTTITFNGMENGDDNFTIAIYNILGQKIVSYTSSPNFHYNRIIWDGKDEFGREVSSGTYIANYTSGQFSKSIKLFLIR